MRTCRIYLARMSDFILPPDLRLRQLKRVTAGESIRIARMRVPSQVDPTRHITQKDFAKLYGVTAPVVCSWERDMAVSIPVVDIDPAKLKPHEICTIMRRRSGFSHQQVAEYIKEMRKQNTDKWRNIRTVSRIKLSGLESAYISPRTVYPDFVQVLCAFWALMQARAAKQPGLRGASRTDARN